MTNLQISEIKFTSRGKEYIIDNEHYFMDNDSCIQYISDKFSYSGSVIVSKKEWNRIKPLLKMSYRDYGYQIVKIYRLF